MNAADEITSEGRGESPLAQAFARDADPRGLYFGPTLQQRVDLIEHLIEFGRQIIVLNGGMDSGKTSLLAHFAGAQRTHWRTVRITAGPGLSAAALLGQIAAELDVDVDAADTADLPARLRQRIAALEKSGRIVVLLVDDADQLVPEVPPAIVHLAHTEDQIAELRVLLAADLDRSALLEMLQRANPQHGLVHVVEIPRLAEEQVKALIGQRLRAIGVDAESCFAEAEYARIAAASDGLVGKVVTLARQHVAGITAAPPRTGKRRGTPQVPAGVVFGVLAAGAVALGAWWAMRNPLLSEAPPAGDGTGTEQIALAPEALDAPADVPAGTSPPATASEPAPPALPAPPAATDVPELPQSPSVEGAPIAATPSPPEAAATPTPSAVAPAPVPAPESAAPAASPAAGQEANVDTPSAAPAPALPPMTPPAGAGRADVAPPPIAAPPAPTPKAPVQVSPAPPPPAKLADASRAPPSPPPPRPRQKPAPKAAAPVAAAPAIANFSGDWLLKQPAAAHTLQLFGVRERAAAERYRQQRGIAAQSAVLTGTLDGRPWYIVVYGFYPTRSGALAAMARLPPGLRDTKPWARSVGSLRDALR